MAMGKFSVLNFSKLKCFKRILGKIRKKYYVTLPRIQGACFIVKLFFPVCNYLKPIKSPNE